MITKIDDFIKRVESTAEEDFFTSRTFYHLSSSMFHEMCELLKELEPILLENQHKPYGISTNANSPWISRCPRCGKKVEGKRTRFCKYCGQAVKWVMKSTTLSQETDQSIGMSRQPAISTMDTRLF